MLTESSPADIADSTFSNVYLNTNSGDNQDPEPPNALTAFAVSTRAIFSWGTGSDDIDESVKNHYKDMSISEEFLTTKRKENLKWHRENKFKK